jgi:hypothetical protein
VHIPANIELKSFRGKMLRNEELGAEGRRLRLPGVKHRLRKSARTGIACAF